MEREAQLVETLREILARPEFAPRQMSAWDQFWAALGNLFVETVLWLLEPLWRATAGAPSWSDLVVITIALLALLVATFYVLRVVRGHMVGESVLVGQLEAQCRARSDRLWREAHDLARNERYDAAVRALYLSALYTLEEHDVLPVQDALTNREHADRLTRERPGAGAPFAAVVQRYDGLRYGGQAVDEAAFTHLSELVRLARTLPSAPQIPTAPKAAVAA